MKHIYTLLFCTIFKIGFSQTFSTNVQVPIPDLGAMVYDSVIVSGLPNVIDSSFGLSKLCFNINHTYDNDLLLRLVAPNGNSIFIANRIGGGDDNFTNTCVAENGVNGFLVNGVAPFTGIYIPLESLNNLNNGQNPNGTWKFEVKDLAAVDTGSITYVSLEFSANPPPTPGPPPELCASCVCPGGVAACNLLPDMTASALSISEDIDSLTHHSQFESAGNINFDNVTPNIGWGPLEIMGVDSCYCGTTLVPCSTMACPNGSMVKQKIRQIYYEKQAGNDTLITHHRTAGFMSYHPTHGHIHVDDWADFTLRTPTSNPDATTWPIVGTGSKTSFCLINLGTCGGYPGYCVDSAGSQLLMPDFPNADFGFYTGCSLHQGIFVGNLDIYAVGLNLGIDLTGVCNGSYYIVSITDPNNNMLEMNDSNNWAAVPVTLYKQNPTAAHSVHINNTMLQVADSATNLVNVSSYFWDFGDGSALVYNTNPVTHQYANAGVYYPTLTVNSPCGNGVFTKTDTVTFLPVGIRTLYNDGLSLRALQNPVKDMLSFEYNLPSDANIQIELVDMLGNSVRKLVAKYDISGKHLFQINQSDLNLSEGSYLIKLNTQNNMCIQKITLLH